MDDRTKLTRVTDDLGRDIISVPIKGTSNRRWRRAWGGSIVGEAGTLRAIGDGRYEYEGNTPDTGPLTGRVGTEADLLAEIGADLGWHMPVEPVVMPGGLALTA